MSNYDAHSLYFSEIIRKSLNIFTVWSYLGYVEIT